MQKKQSESQAKLTIRLPVSIVEAVKRMAVANERSFTGELVFELRTYHRGRRSRRAADPGPVGAAESMAEVPEETTLTPAPEAGSSECGAASDPASDPAMSWPEGQSA